MYRYLAFTTMIAICCSPALAQTTTQYSVPEAAESKEGDPNWVCSTSGPFTSCLPADEQEITVTAMSDAERYDPARAICETISLTGSRLAKMRVCMRSFHWDESRQADRDLIDRMQR